MNKRIQELSEQAGYNIKELDVQEQMVAKKFAELIVEECLAVCQKVHDDCEMRQQEFNIDQMQRQIGINLCKAEIKKHFGVEE